MQTRAYALLGSACLIAWWEPWEPQHCEVSIERLWRDAHSPSAAGARRSRRGSELSARIHRRLSMGAGRLRVSANVGRVRRIWQPSQLVAFDESGDVRTLYPVEGDRFFAGPAPPSRRRPSHGSSFSATTWERSGRSGGGVRMLLRERQCGSRSRSTKTSASPTVTSTWPAHSSVQRKRARSPLSFWFMVRALRIETKSSVGAIPRPPRDRCPRIRQTWRGRILW